MVDWGTIGVLTALNVGLMALVASYVRLRAHKYLGTAYRYFQNRMNLELAELTKAEAGEESSGTNLGGLLSLGQQFLGGGGGTAGLGGIGELIKLLGSFGGPGSTPTPTPGTGSFNPGVKR